MIHLLRAMMLLFAAFVLEAAWANTPVAQLAPKSGRLSMGRIVEVLEDPTGRVTFYASAA